MTDLNSLEWWKLALAGKAPPRNSDSPARGWYRGRKRGEDYKPIAYKYDDSGNLMCKFGNDLVDEATARKMWMFVCKNPISVETYKRVVAGENWPDIDPVVAANNLVSSNELPPINSVEDFSLKLDAAVSGVSEYEKISSDEEASKAQTLRSHLLKLSKDADAKREEEKKPFFEEAKSVDNKWMPVVKKAKEYADKIRAALSTWETSKLQARAKLQETVGTTIVQTKSEPIKGASGRAASVRERRVATAITNLDAFISSVKGRPELEPLLLTLAQKILDENNDVLGVAIEKRADVR